MPKFTLTSKKAAEMSPITKALLQARGTSRGGGVIEWDITSTVSLTETEKAALRRKHGTNMPNLQRAAEVKELMKKGKKCVEIVGLLRKQYGATMIKLDHATLFKVGEGVKAGINSSMNSQTIDKQ